MAVFLIGMAYSVFLVNKADRFLSRISGDPLPSDPIVQLQSDKVPGPTPQVVPDKDLDLWPQDLLRSRSKEEARPKGLTFLVLGVDNRKQTRSMNSDVIMAVAVSPDRQSATVVSLPRDMQLQPAGLPARKANFYYPYYYGKDQATAFANTKQLFSEVFGMPLQHAVAFQFKGFERLVDQLGGVTVDVDMNMRYVDREDGTNINLKKGTQLLHGKEALDFVRYRKSNRNTGESNDYMRNKRQQTVLHQLAGKLKSVNGMMRMGSILDTAGEHIKTDIPSADIRSVMESLLKVDRDQIRFIALQGEWISPYVHVNEEDFLQAKWALRQELEKKAD